MKDIQRDSQSYMEKRRGKRETEVTRSRRGRIKRGESKLASNHFLMSSPQSGSLRDVHRVTQRKEEGGWDRGEQEEKRGNQKRREKLASNHFLKKGVCQCQGCTLPPCLFNLYAEYIMRNTGL